MAKTKDKGGRPPRRDDPTRIVVRLPRPLKVALLHRALDEGRPAGRIIEQLVADYLRKRGGRT